MKYLFFNKKDDTTLITEELLGFHDVYRCTINLTNTQIEWSVTDSVGCVVYSGNSANLMNAKKKSKLQLVKLGVKFGDTRRNFLKNKFTT